MQLRNCKSRRWKRRAIFGLSLRDGSGSLCHGRYRNLYRNAGSATKGATKCSTKCATKGAMKVPEKPIVGNRLYLDGSVNIQDPLGTTLPSELGGLGWTSADEVLSQSRVG